jgi:ABC-type branched-subunit amino acid transport system ATPase component
MAFGAYAVAILGQRGLPFELGLVVGAGLEHNMEVVMSLCQRIVVLSQGERIAEGTPVEVADNPLVLDAYFGR